MIGQILSRFRLWPRNRYYLILAFFWIVGLIAGIWGYSCSTEAISLLMRNVPMAPVSIVGFWTVSLPFLFSAFSVFCSIPHWFLPIAFFKAFLLAFVSIGLKQTFGYAGWLYQRLLLWDWLMMPALYLYWLRYGTGARRYFWLSFFALMLGYLYVGGLEIRIISSVLTGIENW